MASPATLDRHGLTTRTIGKIVCLFCKHDGTLLHMKPHRGIYACQSCVTMRGGRMAVMQDIPEAVSTFHQRKPV